MEKKHLEKQTKKNVLRKILTYNCFFPSGSLLALTLFTSNQALNSFLFQICKAIFQQHDNFMRIALLMGAHAYNASACTSMCAGAKLPLLHLMMTLLSKQLPKTDSFSGGHSSSQSTQLLNYVFIQQQIFPQTQRMSVAYVSTTETNVRQWKWTTDWIKIDARTLHNLASYILHSNKLMKSPTDTD